MWPHAGTVHLRSCSTGCTTTRQVVSTHMGAAVQGGQGRQASSQKGLGGCPVLGDRHSPRLKISPRHRPELKYRP